MARLRANIAMSLDGFVAGPDQSVENPLGKGGMQLHEWAFGLAAWRKPARHGGRRGQRLDRGRRGDARRTSERP